MEITIEDLRRRFTEYNKLYFRGKLKMPEFKIGTSSDAYIGVLYRTDFKFGHCTTKIAGLRPYNRGLRPRFNGLMRPAHDKLLSGWLTPSPTLILKLAHNWTHR